MPGGQDIGKLVAELERLRKLVYYDELTGVLNRRVFQEEAGKIFHAVSLGRTELERRIQRQIPFSVVFLDIDDFKHINDRYGHAAGDKALREVAAMAQKHLRSGDLIGRWGGEEFVIALVGAGQGVAKAVAEKLRLFISGVKLPLDGETVQLTASLGVVQYGSERSLLELIDNADKAMYQAKQGGKNRVIVFGKDS